MFAVGDLIIYGGEGVCKVESIGAPLVSGANKDRLYYTLSPLYRTGRVFAPVDSPVFMRPVISRQEAIDLIRQIPSIRAEVYENRNLRFLTEHYQETMQSHNCSDLVKLIKDVYLKRQNANEKGKKLGQIDERFMRRAEDMLYSELAVALELPKDDVCGYIAEAVKKMEAGEEFTG
ncbi:MAG: CarD family transcriptional regulator [Oscillospiraceae bacterium]